jgi:hypothetical protein
MFDHLGFIVHLTEKYFPNYTKRDLQITRWFNPEAKDERNVSGYIASLVKPTTRYNAKAYISEVEDYYQTLK